MTTKPSYNVFLMHEDMARKGWLASDLARKTRPRITDETVRAFLRGQNRSARTAKKLARALGYDVERYLISARQAVA